MAQNYKSFLKNNFHALTHKNFRYYFLGQCVSLMGTWMQNIAQSWLVLSITNSPFKLGVLSTVQFLPVMIFSLFAGVLIDKFSKKKIIIMTQTVSMILAFLLAILVFSGAVQFWHVLILAALLGFANTIDMPARQSFIIEIAGKKDLMNAIALNSAVFNLARIIGPAVGAVLISYVGIAWCFLLNGISFIAVIFGLFRIKVDTAEKEVKKVSGNVLKDIMDGLNYAAANPIILEVILIVLVLGIFGFNFNVLIPVYTKNTLGMQEKAYGFLLSCMGAGSLLGAIAASLRSKRGPKKALIFNSGLFIGLLLIIIGISKQYYASALLLFIIGIFNILFSTTCNSSLQVNSKNEFRGRIMSIYSLVFVGSAPLGSFLSGVLSEKLGAGETFIIFGAAVFVIVVLLKLIFMGREKYKSA